MQMQMQAAAGEMEQPMQRCQRASATRRRIPLQHMEEIADQRFAVLRRVHAIDENLWRLGAVETGVDVVAGFALPLSGGIDGGGRVWARQRCDAVGLGRHDGERGHVGRESGGSAESGVQVGTPRGAVQFQLKVGMRWSFGGWFPGGAGAGAVVVDFWTRARFASAVSAKGRACHSAPTAGRLAGLLSGGAP